MSEIALLPIHATDDAGRPVYLCACCKRVWEFSSLARICALQDVALFESVPVIR